MADHFQPGDVCVRFGLPVTEILLDDRGRVTAAVAE